MQTRSSDENSVCPSVRLSVCLSVKHMICDKIEERSDIIDLSSTTVIYSAKKSVEFREKNAK